MGAIQSAINQGIATAGVLYSQSDLAEQRKKERAEEREVKKLTSNISKLQEPEPQVMGDVKLSDEAIGKADQAELAKSMKARRSEVNEQEVYNQITTPMKARLYSLTGDPNYVKSIGRDKLALQGSQEQYENASYNFRNYDRVRAQNALQRTQDQMQQAKSIKPHNFYKKLREMELNGEQ